MIRPALAVVGIKTSETAGWCIKSVNEVGADWTEGTAESSALFSIRSIVKEESLIQFIGV